MDYIFNEKKFIKSFRVKPAEEKSPDSLRLQHRPNDSFKLYPYKARQKEQQAPIVTDLKEIISSFFRRALNMKADVLAYDVLCEFLISKNKIAPDDCEMFKDMIRALFFDGDDFVATSFGLYPYQSKTNNKSADDLAYFLFCILGINQADCEEIKNAINCYPYNVIEKMLMEAINATEPSEDKFEKPYFPVVTDVQKKFKRDFYFMLRKDMTSMEDFSNLFSLYYFYYVSQTCLVLDQFCQGKRDDPVPLYYALDWEKVSKNRKCCSDGWEKLWINVRHVFSHAMTLAIINQHEDDELMYDYIMLQEYIDQNPEEDELIAREIQKAETAYTDAVGDYKKFADIKYIVTGSKTDAALRHLFKCVEEQFFGTDRKGPSNAYQEKFSEFCKVRWIKNRSKSGLVLNLTERDIIFLTKISLQNKDKIRLIDLYKEYEYRGIFLDNTSKEHLQEFFTKLNLIDRKSDSGDAQYVKRIL